MRSANHRDNLGHGAAVHYLRPIFAASSADILALMDCIGPLFGPLTSSDLVSFQCMRHLVYQICAATFPARQFLKSDCAMNLAYSDYQMV